MSLESLDEFKALSPGCDVWIVATPATSKWARKIDWYLGFQIMKATTRVPRRISDDLKSILISEELDELPESSIDHRSSLMVASSRYLPVRQTIVVPYSGNLADWSEKCHHIWQNLTFPRLRVFLPDSVALKPFMASWPGARRESQPVEVV